MRLARTRLTWIAIAFVALALGALFYAIARPHPAAFLPAGWHRPVLAITSYPLATGFAGALPTFLHAAAMSLLVATASRAATPYGRGLCCATVCAVEIAFEVAQHPVVAAALLGSAPASAMTGGIDRALRSYLTHGTFDPLDLLGACAGCLVAFTVLGRAAHDRQTSLGARHAAA